MQVEFVLCSPRPRGNTFLLADRLDRALAGENIKTRMLDITGRNINPCQDCRACKTGDLKCVLTDEMIFTYARLEAADVIVIGTPIYWFGPTAQAKLMIDRLRPYYKNGKLKDKKAALLLPAGSGSGDCDLTIEMFVRIFKALGIEYLGAVTAKAYDIGDVETDPGVPESILRLAARIKG